MIFRFSAPYSYLLGDIEFYFHLRSIFRLLPSKIGMVDNSEPALSKKKKYCVKFKDTCCNKLKLHQKSRNGEGFALCTVCGSDFSLEKMISIDTRSPESTRDMWMLHNNKEN